MRPDPAFQRDLDALTRLLPARSFHLISPLPLGAEDVDALLARPEVRGLSLVDPAPALLARHAGRLGAYRFGQRFRVAGGAFPVLLASRTLLTKWMMEAALRAGRIGVYCLTPQGFRLVPVQRFALWRVGDRLIEYLNTAGGVGRRRLPFRVLNRLAQGAYAHPRLRAIVRAAMGRPPLAPASGQTGCVASAPPPFTPLEEETVRARLHSLLQEVHASPPPYRAEPGRILHINAGLGAGGAERQVVNTLLGLKARGVDVSFVGESVFGAQELSFYLPLLEGGGVDVQQVPRRFSLTRGDLTAISPTLARMDSLLPGFVLEEIANLVLLLRERRPQVLHAWQDSTSIKAAIAGILTGVPTVLLSSRNVNPTNFAYALPYMRPAYQALATFPHLVFLNNSEAGRQDYATWLGLPPARYALVRNGMNFHKLARSGAADQAAFRDRWGIPPDALLVGALFRFWPEKRPLLWLATVAELARRRPTLHAVLAGDGPLKAEMLAHLATLAPEVTRRLHLIPPQQDIAPLLSSLDLFLLVSRFEGTPNVVLEAQWCGAPVVVTEAGGTAEALLPGVTGHVVPAAGGEESALIASLVNACESVLDAPAFKQRVETEGQDFITSRFGFDRMIDETCALYPSLTPVARSSAVVPDTATAREAC